MANREATLHTIILKNVDETNPSTGLEVASIIVNAAETRPHLRRHIQSFQWDRQRGIGILVDEAGHRDHLANAMNFDTHGEPDAIRHPYGTGYSRTGTVAGFTVTIWNLER